MNLYSHQGTDRFDQALDRLMNEKGAHKSMAHIANFLKHADRDPEGVLSSFHPDLTAVSQRTEK
jgi:hypothetical protein